MMYPWDMHSETNTRRKSPKKIIIIKEKEKVMLHDDHDVNLTPGFPHLFFPALYTIKICNSLTLFPFLISWFFSFFSLIVHHFLHTRKVQFPNLQPFSFFFPFYIFHGRSISLSPVFPIFFKFNFISSTFLFV